MCEYCKVYTDEEMVEIEESDKNYDINRIETGITGLADEPIDFGILGKCLNWLYLQVSEEEGNQIVSQICGEGDICHVTKAKIKYCPFCGRKL